MRLLLCGHFIKGSLMRTNICLASALFCVSASASLAQPLDEAGDLNLEIRIEQEVSEAVRSGEITFDFEGPIDSREQYFRQRSVERLVELFEGSEIRPSREEIEAFVIRREKERPTKATMRSLSAYLVQKVFGVHYINEFQREDSSWLADIPESSRPFDFMQSNSGYGEIDPEAFREFKRSILLRSFEFKPNRHLSEIRAFYIGVPNAEMIDKIATSFQIRKLNFQEGYRIERRYPFPKRVTLDGRLQVLGLEEFLERLFKEIFGAPHVVFINEALLDSSSPLVERRTETVIVNELQHAVDREFSDKAFSNLESVPYIEREAEARSTEAEVRYLRDVYQLSEDEVMHDVTYRYGGGAFDEDFEFDVNLAPESLRALVRRAYQN